MDSQNPYSTSCASHLNNNPSSTTEATQKRMRNLRRAQQRALDLKQQIKMSHTSAQDITENTSKKSKEEEEESSLQYNKSAKHPARATVKKYEEHGLGSSSWIVEHLLEKDSDRRCRYERWVWTWTLLVIGYVVWRKFGEFVDLLFKIWLEVKYPEMSC